MKLNAAAASYTSQLVRINKTFLQMKVGTRSSLDSLSTASRAPGLRLCSDFARAVLSASHSEFRSCSSSPSGSVATVASAAMFKEEAEPKVVHATLLYAKVMGCRCRFLSAKRPNASNSPASL